MLEAIGNWLQDWLDACEYANECVPDFSFIDAFHPNKWLQIIIILAFIFLVINEWRIKLRQHVCSQAANDRPDHFTLKTLFSGSILGDLATTSYIAIISALAQISGFRLLLFPELGALSNEILRKPKGIWANTPMMLMITPFFTGLIGTIATQHLPYGMISILVSVIAGIIIIRLLGSPIAPAISAGLLPVTLGETSWWYPFSLLAGTGLLATLSAFQRRWNFLRLNNATPVANIIQHKHTAHSSITWIPFFLIFLLIAAYAASQTQTRFLLFPPLIVIAYEMFAHASVCPWAHRPLILPLACGLAAGAGVVIVGWLGTGPIAAGLAVFYATVVLRGLDIHVPPTIAVSLLPFVIPKPDYHYAIAVALGTTLLIIIYSLWRAISPLEDVIPNK